MPKLKINDIEIEVAPGTSILQACEQLGSIGSNSAGSDQLTFYLYSLSSAHCAAAKCLAAKTAHFLEGYVTFAAHDLETAAPQSVTSPTQRPSSLHRRSLSQPATHVEQSTAAAS